MSTVRCFDVQGRLVEVSRRDLAFRPAAYGLLVEDDQVLLLPNPNTGLWQPPGGALEPDEAPGPALRERFLLSTGVLPRLGPLLYAEERFCLDADGQAWHLACLYYALERTDTGVAGLIGYDRPGQPEWVLLDNLDESSMQFGYGAIQAARAPVTRVRATGAQDGRGPLEA